MRVLLVTLTWKNCRKINDNPIKNKELLDYNKIIIIII